ncbi:eukaryotic initiation factor 4E [Ceratocystis lukuohia]|uniref:Eukaryotic initiation factor 4E n=1 Tax=Ceratocystis lukuohia TaxID=2019550 RepID=A0ABR4MGQ5_9PEZI
MSTRPPFPFARTSGLSQATTADSISSPSGERDDAKRNFLKAMRPLPTQHYWDVYFNRTLKDQTPNGDEYQDQLEQLCSQIDSVQEFWKYHNNFPVDQIKMRESIYLFKQGFKPIWEDRRNIHGGSWTFRVPKSQSIDIWTRVQLLAIGEKLESVLEEGDQICGVGLSVRFNSHLITVWHRDASKKKSIENLLKCVLDEFPEDKQPKADTYFYKKHSDHSGFKATPEIQAVLDSKKRNEEAAAAAAAAAAQK